MVQASRQPVQIRISWSGYETNPVVNPVAFENSSNDFRSRLMSTRSLIEYFPSTRCSLETGLFVFRPTDRNDLFFMLNPVLTVRSNLNTDTAGILQEERIQRACGVQIDPPSLPGHQPGIRARQWQVLCGRWRMKHVNIRPLARHWQSMKSRTIVSMQNTRFLCCSAVCRLTAKRPSQRQEQRERR